MITQASRLKELVEFVSNMSAKGFKMSVNKRGDVCGIRRGSAYQGMIKGQKAYYSKAHFKQIGYFIFEKNSLKPIDRLA